MYRYTFLYNRLYFPFRKHISYEFRARKEKYKYICNISLFHEQYLSNGLRMSNKARAPNPNCDSVKYSIPYTMQTDFSDDVGVAPMQAERRESEIRSLDPPTRLSSPPNWPHSPGGGISPLIFLLSYKTALYLVV